MGLLHLPSDVLDGKLSKSANLAHKVEWEVQEFSPARGIARLSIVLGSGKIRDDLRPVWKRRRIGELLLLDWF